MTISNSQNSPLNVLVIDNFDSFVFNLYQMLGELLEKRKDNSQIRVIRNNEMTLEAIKSENFTHIVVGPGPGNPEDTKYFGVNSSVIKDLGKTTPILGVCLGMQGICSVFGASIVHASVPMHGKISPVIHTNDGVYSGLPQGVEIMRYHSLVAKPNTLPDCLEITCVVANGVRDSQSQMDEFLENGAEIMGVKHKEYPIQGIQFHPESFGTEGGFRMLANFLNQ